MSVAADIDQRIAQVKDAHARAVGELEEKWFRSEEADHALAALKSLAKPIATWADDGHRGAAAPSYNWAKWIESGNTHLSTISEIYDIGVTARLANITATVKDTVADTKAVAKKIGAVTKTVVKETTETAGAGLGAILGPIKPVLYIVAGVAGLGALAYLAMRFAPRKAAA